jgi:hypothetical protein
LAGNKNSGRLSRQADQNMVEALSVYTNDVYRVLHENILKGEYWAIRIWFERVHGKVIEQKELTVNNEQPLFSLTDVWKFEGDKE